jgi:hypothetical protein
MDGFMSTRPSGKINQERNAGGALPIEDYIERFSNFDCHLYVREWEGRWPPDLAGGGVERHVEAIASKAMAAKVDEIIASGEPFTEIARGDAVMEAAGWDVVLIGNIHIELKPQVGDDYPSILRAMKRRRYDGPRALIVQRFDAEGATYDQVKKMFAASGIKVRTLDEIQKLIRR